MIFPLRKIEVQPTRRCNLNCPPCIGRGLKAGQVDQIPKERLMQLAEEVRTLEVGHVVISAMYGEPLLHVGVNSFIKRLKEGPSEKQYIGLHTNGTLLNEPTAELLTSDNRRGDYVHIHLDAPAANPNLYKIVHGASPCLQRKTLSAIELLTNKKARKPNAALLSIRIVCLLSAWHKISDLEKMVFELTSRGVDTIRFSVPIVPIATNSPESYFITSRQISDFVRAHADLNALGNGKVEFPGSRMAPRPENIFSRCFVKDSALVVGPDGRLSPCCYTTYPGFPHKLVARPDESFIDLARRMAGLEFDPRQVCPPCSRDDHERNRAAQEKGDLG